jgi:hypothetical protein
VALLLIMGCGVEGVTALLGVGLNHRCEIGFVICLAIGCTTLGDVTICGTLGGENVICTLGGVSLLAIWPWGGGRIFLYDGSAPSKIADNLSSASI